MYECMNEWILNITMDPWHIFHAKIVVISRLNDKRFVFEIETNTKYTYCIYNVHPIARPIRLLVILWTDVMVACCMYPEIQCQLYFIIGNFRRNGSHSQYQLPHSWKVIIECICENETNKRDIVVDKNWIHSMLFEYATIHNINPGFSFGPW